MPFALATPGTFTASPSTATVYEDLQVRSNIPLEDLKRHLMSLYVNPKVPIRATFCEEKKSQLYLGVSINGGTLKK